MKPSLIIPVAFVLLVSACRGRDGARSAQRSAAARALPSAEPAPPPSDALASVSAFDCSSSLAEKRGETLRAFRGAGPSGSAFNWQPGELVCEVRFRVGCRTSGRLRIEVGRRALPEEEFGLTMGGELSAQVRVPSALWAAELEPQGERLYRPLSLAAHVEGTCAGADAGPPRSYEARDAFVAGFASGE